MSGDLPGHKGPGSASGLIDQGRTSSLTHPVQKRVARYVLFFLFIVAIVFFVAFDLKRFLTLESLRDQQFAIQRFYTMHPSETVALYFFTSVIFVVCCLPAASLVMLASGAIFG